MTNNGEAFSLEAASPMAKRIKFGTIRWSDYSDDDDSSNHSGEGAVSERREARGSRRTDYETQAAMEADIIESLPNRVFDLGQTKFSKTLVESLISILHELRDAKTSEELFSCYCRLIKTVPQKILDNLRLYFDDGLMAKLNHFYELLTVGLAEFEVGKIIFVEGFLIDSTLHCSVDIDMLNLTDCVAVDFTSSRDSFIREKKSRTLEFNWKNERVGVNVRVFNWQLAFTIRPSDSCWDLVKKICPESFSRIIDLEKAEAKKKRPDSKAWEIIDTMVDGLVEKARGRMEDETSYLDPLPDENIQKVTRWCRSNRDQVVESFYDDAPNNEFIAILRSYLREYNGTPERNLDKMGPASSLPFDESSIWVKFVNGLEELEVDFKTWYDFTARGEFVESSFQKGRLRRHMYYTDAEEPFATVRCVSPRTYDIIFNITNFLKDYHLTDTLTKKDRKEAGSLRDEKRCDIEELPVADILTGSINKNDLSELVAGCRAESERLMEDLGEHVEGSVFKKISQNQLDLVLGERTKQMVLNMDKTLGIVLRSRLAHSVSHEYELAKSQAASMAVPLGYNRYFLSRNGPYSSKSLIQRNCTQDNFTTVFCLTLYVDLEGRSRLNKSISFNRNTLEWAVKKPFLIQTVLSWALEHRLSDNVAVANLRKDLGFLMEICCVNSDVFAQVQDVTRYAYTAALSYDSNLLAALDKIKPLMPMTTTEVLYTMRLFKTVISLESLKAKGSTKILNQKTGAGFAMPQDLGVCADFSYFVSSMYTSRLYNKLKAFPGPSEALCMQGVIDEIEEFKKKAEDKEWLGEEKEILERCTSNLKGRYNGSSLVAWAAGRIAPKTEGLKSAFFMSSLEGLANDRAAMSGFCTEPVNQTTKSALSFIDGITTINSSKDISSVSLKTYYNAMLALEYMIRKPATKYASYIVKKDQVGHREIYVMNYPMRVGSYAVEEVARVLSTIDEVNVQSTKNKDKIMEEYMNQAHRIKAAPGYKMMEVYDNADAKRWGPNMQMDMLFAFMVGLVTAGEPDLILLLGNTFARFTEKQIKFPASLIKHAKDHDCTGKGVVNKFCNKYHRELTSNKPFVVEPMGMGQGIFQEFSSLYHAAKQKLELTVIRRLFGNLKFSQALVTSDDSFKVLSFEVSMQERISRTGIFKTLGYIARASGTLFGILRNEAKSSFNCTRAEFNSNFNYLRSPAVPTLKFRAAKMELGSGIDLFEDLLRSLGAAADYMAKGGSYLGSYSLSSCCYTLFLEQWRLTRQELEANDSKLSVAGYVKFVDPYICLVSSPLIACVISDLYGTEVLEDRDLLSKVARMLVKAMESAHEKVLFPAHRADEMTAVIAEEVQEAKEAAETLQVPEGAVEEPAEMTLQSFYAGVFTVARRHVSHVKYVKSGLKEVFKKERKSYSIAEHAKDLRTLWTRFDANSARALSRSGDMDFHKRFSEPWFSREKARMKKTKGDFLSSALDDLPDLFSLVEFLEAIKGQSDLVGKIVKEAEVPVNLHMEPLVNPFRECLELGSILIEQLRSETLIEGKDLVPKLMPRLVFRALDVPTSNIEGEEIAKPTMLAKLLGKRSRPIIAEFTSEIMLYSKYEVEADTKLEVADAIALIETYSRRIDRIKAGSLVFLVPSAEGCADPRGILLHLIRDRYIEGSGYAEVDDTKISRFITVQDTFRMLKEEADFVNLVGEAAGEHLNNLHQGKISDLGKLINSRVADSEFLTQRTPESIGKSKLKHRRVMLSIICSLARNIPLQLDLEDLKYITQGTLSLTARVYKGEELLRVFMATRVSGTENKLGYHVTHRVGYRRKQQWRHYFVFKQPKTRAPVTSIKIDRSPEATPFKVGETVREGKYGRSDFVKFVYPEDLSLSRITASDKSTVLILEARDFAIPLMPLVPSEGSLDFFGQVSEDDIVTASADCMKIQTEILKMTIKKKGLEMAEEDLKNIRDYDGKSADPKGRLRAATRLLGGQLNYRPTLQAVLEMVSTPFYFGDKWGEMVGDTSYKAQADSHALAPEIAEWEDDDELDLAGMEKLLEELVASGIDDSTLDAEPMCDSLQELLKMMNPKHVEKVVETQFRPMPYLKAATAKNFLAVMYRSLRKAVMVTCGARNMVELKKILDDFTLKCLVMALANRSGPAGSSGHASAFTFYSVLFKGFF